MSFASKHKKGGIQWGIDTAEFEYFKLEDLFKKDGADATYQLCGVFINRNKTEKELKEYGPSVVAILGDKLVNLPSHMEEEVKAIMSDEEDIADIKAGNVWFKIRSYESHGKTCYSPDWLEEDEVAAIKEATKKEK